MAKSKPAPPSTLLDKSEEPQVRMSFGEHLDELRKCLIAAIAGSIAGIALCLYYVNHIVDYVLRPYRLALMAHHYPAVFSAFKPAEVVINYLTIGVEAGLVVSSPWIILQIWKFVGAGLFQRERRIVYRYIGPSAVLFLVGVAFFYYLVLPLTLNFFVGFTDKTVLTQPTPTWIENQMGLKIPAPGIEVDKLPRGEDVPMQPIPVVRSDPKSPPPGFGYLYYDATQGTIKFRVGDETLTMLVVQSGSLFVNTPRFDDYMSFVMWTGIIFGLAFEMPMVILILGQIGLVLPKTFRKTRKYAYFAILGASVIIAPSPDWLTPLTFFIPLVALYELGIVLASIAVRKKAKAAT